MKKIGLGLVALLVVGAAVGLLRNTPPTNADGSQVPDDHFSEEGSFRDDEGNRIYTIKLDPKASAQKVRLHAERLEFANGKVTAAYFYAEEAVIPLHSVTFASSVEQANRVIEETRGYSPWRYAFMRAPEGQVQFVDCLQTPDDGLCRKP